MALTRKQRAFIDEYLIDFNATQAAIRAGYSERTAYSIGWENLRKPEIQEAIDRLVSEQAMSAEEVRIRLGEMGRGNLARYINPYGDFNMDLLKEDGLGHLLKKHKTRKQRIIRKDGSEIENEWHEHELYDAQSALNTLAKIHGLTDKSPAGTEDDPVHVVMYIPDNDRDND